MGELGRINVIVRRVKELLPAGPLRGLEVGVWNGQTSEGLLRLIPDLYMWGVDSYVALPQEVYKTNDAREWTQEKWDNQYAVALAKLQPYDGHFKILRMFSTDAMPEFDNDFFDFIFIDGNHGYDYVRQDIPGWWPKLRTGGILFGHDYGHDGVKKAVTEFSEAHKLSVTTEEDSMWWVVKP